MNATSRNPEFETLSQNVWPAADPEHCERRGWGDTQRLCWAMVTGALLAAFVHGESLAYPSDEPSPATVDWAALGCPRWGP